MAIDTAEKRFSFQAYSGGDAAICSRLDGVNLINAGDRSHLLGRYRGIAIAAAATWATISGRWLYSAANHTALVGAYLEMDLAASSGTVRGRLYDVTASAAVAGSGISTTSGTEARVRSGNLSGVLVNGHEYVKQVSADAGATGSWFGRRLILVNGS